MKNRNSLNEIKDKEIDKSSLPLILQRAISKEEYFPDGEIATDGSTKTGTWSDCDQDA